MAKHQRGRRLVQRRLEGEEYPPPPRKYSTSLREIAVLVAVVVLFRSFLWEPFRIPSSSMEPGLIPGDYVVVAKYAYGYSRHSLPFSAAIIKNKIAPKLPKRGDVVVFRHGRDNRFFIKRVIGLPGDTIKTNQNSLFINNQKVTTTPTQLEGLFSEHLPNEKDPHLIRLYASYQNKGYKVPRNTVFLMGDNRQNSVDSRYTRVGFIGLEKVVGRAEFIAFSLENNPPIWKLWLVPKAILLDRFGKTIQ